MTEYFTFRMQEPHKIDYHKIEGSKLVIFTETKQRRAKTTQ